jgi:hypothetical protein
MMRAAALSALIFWLIFRLAISSTGEQSTLQAPQSFLNFSSPAPHIFSSVSGLFEQWSNTFFPNGHTIAACEIPRNTLLYHGRHDSDLPTSPEFLAFDVEMSYAIMGSLPDSRMLTYRTEKTVKCLYFDGMSASLMGSGTESQMTFLYGDSDSIPPRRPPGRPGSGHWNPLEDEYVRARGLCKWLREHDLGGKGHGFEGIVRMNAAFEVIWCDFASPSLQLVSNLNVSAPRIKMRSRSNTRGFSPNAGDAKQASLAGSTELIHILDEGPHAPMMTDPSEPFRAIANFMWFTAATRRYGSTGNKNTGPGRGETRARIDSCGLFTFYDPELKGQASARASQERALLNISLDGQWQSPSDGAERKVALDQLMRRRRTHRTNHVTREDGAHMYKVVRRRLKDALNASETCSGIEWQQVAQEIVTFYSKSLRDLLDGLDRKDEFLVREDELWISVRSWLLSLRNITHWLMVKFFEYPPGPYEKGDLPDIFSVNSPAALAAVRRCRTQYSPIDTDTEKLHDGEKLLLSSIEDTLDGLCSSIFRIGLGVELVWLLHFNIDPEDHDPYDKDINPLSAVLEAKSWKQSLEDLMAWLGWVEQWTGCDGPCAPGVSHFQMDEDARICSNFTRRTCAIFPYGR